MAAEPPRSVCSMAPRPGTYDVLARYTYYGDANLNGKVDGSDYSLIDAAFTAKAAATWGNGNFNYDNAINGSDYTPDRQRVQQPRRTGAGSDRIAHRADRHHSRIQRIYGQDRQDRQDR